MNNQAIVESFCEAWSAMNFAAVIDHLHDDIFYHNIPMQPLHGIDAVRDYLQNAWQFEACEWRLLNIVANGDIVMTERIDEFIIDGNRVSLPLMGVFELLDRKILRWRDYFDLASYRAQLQAAKQHQSPDNNPQL